MQTSTQMASLNLDFVNEDEKEDELQTLKNVEPTQRSSLNLDFVEGDEKSYRDASDEEERTISKEEYANNPEFIANLQDYAVKRFGVEGGAKQEDETNEEYFERFLTHKRAIEENSIDQGGQIDWIRGASPEDRDQFVDLYIDVENNLPNFYEKGGGNTGSALFDYIFYNVSEPMNLIGGLFGRFFGKAVTSSIKDELIKYGRKAALKKAKREGLKRGIKIGAVTEGTAEAVKDLGTQRIEQANLDIEDVEINPYRTALIGGVGAVAGGIGFGLQQRSDFADVSEYMAYRKKQIKEAKEKVAQTADDKIESDKIAKEVSDKADEELGLTPIGEVFDPINGKAVASALADYKKSGVIEPVMQKDLLKRVTRFAEDIFDEYRRRGDLPPEVDLNMKATEVIGTIIRNVDNLNVDSALLDQAISKAGLTPELIKDLYGFTTSSAGSILQAPSNLGKKLKKARDLSPEFVKRLDELAGKDQSTTNIFGRVWDFVRRLDREGRALAVTRFSTTAGNLATLGATQTMQTAANAIESTLYHLGKSTASIMDGTASVAGARQGFKDLIKDTFGTLAYLDNAELSNEMVSYLLKHNPAMARVIDRSLGEVGEESLSKFTRMANTLNMLQDVFARRAVFSAAADKHLRRAGLDFDTIVAENKALPISVLKNAQREALSATFAAMPRTVTQGGNRAEHVAHHFVKMVEQLPFLPVIGTGELPYVRFMVNALAHQLSYSPVGGLNAAANLTNAMFRKYGKQINDATTAADLAKAKEQLSKSIVGSSALYAAVLYREENQDLKPHEMRGQDGGIDIKNLDIKKSGKPTDVRRFWPAAPILTLADILVKFKNGKFNEIYWSEVKENLIGTRFRMGQFGESIDSLMKILYEGGIEGIKAEEFSTRIGAYIGEMGTRFTTPAKLATDIIAVFDEEEAVVRDASQVEGDMPGERFIDAAKKKLYANMPFLQRDLPVKEHTTRGEERYLQSPMLRLFFGISSTERRTNVEKELLKHTMQDFQLSPRTGDNRARAIVNKYLGPLVEKKMGDLVEDEYYKQASAVRQKQLLTKELSEVRRLSYLLGRLDERRTQGEEGPTTFSRGDWIKLSSQQRALADEVYQDKYGKSVLDQQRADPSVDHYRLGAEIARLLTSL